MKKITSCLSRKVNITTIVLLFIIAAGCSDKDKSDIDCPVIDFNSDSFIEIENVHLDTIVKNIEYVFLETTLESQIGRISDIGLTESSITIISNREIFIFDREGKFITKLGSNGRGPEEYNAPLNIIYDKQRMMFIIYDYKHILEFDSNYNFIRKIKQEHSKLKRFELLESGIFVGDLQVDRYPDDSTKYSLLFLDDNYKCIKKIESKDQKKQIDGIFFMVDLMGGLNSFDNHIYFKEQYNDTICMITKKMEMEPALCLNFADEKYPKKLNFDINLYMEQASMYIQLSKFTIVEDIFLSSFRFEGNYMYAYTSINNNETIIPFQYINNEKVYGYILSAFNEYLFRPTFIDGYLSREISAIDARKKLNTDSPEISDKIKEKILDLNENDNPILILAHY